MVDKLPIMPVVNVARYKLQPVHYEDLADGYYKVLVNEEATANKDYNLSGGSEIELREMLTVIGENLGKKVQRLCEPRVFSYEDAKRDFGYSPRTFQDGIMGEVKEYQ